MRAVRTLFHAQRALSCVALLAVAVGGCTGDIVGTVAGTPRPTGSAEQIKVPQGKPAPERPSELITTNEVPQNARRSVVAIDQTLITPGSTVPLQRTASAFVASAPRP